MTTDNKEAAMGAQQGAADDWPECSLRDGGTVCYGHPVQRAAMDDLRQVCGRLKAAGALAILVGREREDVPGYPRRYLTVRAVMTEEDW